MDSNVTPNQQNTEIVALILGITATVLALSVFDVRHLFLKVILGVACAIIGLILGISSNKKGRNGLATAGIILSCIGLAIFLLSILACSACAIIGCASLSFFL
jgi:hypothetical protein